MAGALRWEPQITVAEGIARYVAWLRGLPEAIPDWLRTEGDRVASWNPGAAPT